MPIYLVGYMSLLTLTDGSNVFQLNKQESIQLELKLNKTMYARKWIEIGDHLFNFGSGRSYELQIILDQEQYAFQNSYERKRIHIPCPVYGVYAYTLISIC